MEKNKTLTLILILAVCIFGIHVFNVKTEGARVDFTQTDLFSLTKGTQDILAKMTEEGVKPIEIKLYFSATTGKMLPKFIKNFITYEKYVRNLLKEYERYSNGKIQTSVIDPKADSDEAEDAGDYGLDGKPINQEGDLFFFGLVFETQTGSKDVIDFLWPEKQETIEYEISKRIYNLLWPTKKRIGVLSGLEPLPDNNPYMMQMMQMQGKQPSEPWIAMKVLEESYQVARIDPDAESISRDEYDLVLVIHPKSFSEKTLWSLNEWVVKGGNTIVFLDPYSIEDRAPNNPQQPWAQLQYKPASDLGKLLDTWGISRKEDQFAVDYDLAVKRPVDRSGGSQVVITDLRITDKTAAEALDPDSPILQGLNDIRFFMAGILEKKADAKADIKPLITTTKAGGSLTIMPGFGDKGLAYTDLNNPHKLLDAYSPSDSKQALAYMISGKLDSAFPEGATFPKETPQAPPGMPPGFQMPPAEDAEMITKEAIPEDQFAETRVLVFSDVDFITNQLAFQQSIFGTQAVNDNYKVLINSVDFLLGARELMDVRSKKNIRRPFKLFDAIEARADKDVLDQEQSIRAEIEGFQEDLREKQRGMNQKDAVLFQKKLAEDIDKLNENIRKREKELREIKKVKRAALESEERLVSMSIMWLMPVLICLGGIAMHLRRKSTAHHSSKE